MPRRFLPAFILTGVALFMGGLSFLLAQEGGHKYDPKVGKASEDWKATLKRLQLPKGVTADLWAAEPHVANIISFAFDEKGRAYVAETFRLGRGVTDNRGHMNWLDADLASRTVADRVAMYKKFLGPKEFAKYEQEHDRVRLVEDTKGTGRADRATVFADGFNKAEDGLGSGLLARDGKVWYTNIPALWLLQDTTGDGVADVKKALHTGYGVHVSFIGHDSHGLKMGPDGKVYFSIGDRGLNVTTAEGKRLVDPDTGTVLRCNPDGTELEIVATGFRNPQELAFDEFGNLFTGDNNADGGDKARWVHVVEGGDTGWRIGYQYLPGLGPWNAEKLWHTADTNTAAYLLPPLAHLANGPSGLTYHPGTSLLPDRYNGHFFLCDFRGAGNGSGVHAVKVAPKGASFQLGKPEQFVWNVLATDADFGPDGGFYVSDWIDGWGLTNKGRIWKLSDPEKQNDPAVKEVKTQLAEGFTKRPTDELVKLLDHADMRVRQEAQFALVAKKDEAALHKVFVKGKGLARLHAIWGLGQLKKTATLELVALNESDPEVLAQMFKVLGHDPATRNTLALLSKGVSHDGPRVRFYAALAAGKVGSTSSLPGVLEMLRKNADADPYLRHAGVMALTGIATKGEDKTVLKQAGDDPASAVRLAALLTMRRLQSPEVARFLTDADGKLVLEAARAIYDTPIPDALPKLAALAERGGVPAAVREPVLLRALAAGYRLGGRENAEALAKFAARNDMPEKLREEALKLLTAWEKPSGRDRVVGLWRPLPERPAADVAAAIRPALGGIMTGPNKVRAAGASLAAKHGIKELGPVLREMVADASRPAAVRVETLKALEALKDAQLDQAAKAALADPDPRLRHEARRITLTKAPPAEAVKVLGKVLDDGTVIEQQGALAILADLKGAEADTLLGQEVDELLARKAPAEVQLDILEAARKRGTPALKQKLAKYEADRPKDDPVGAYRESLAGGDAEAGRRIFFDKADVYCQRCHKVNGSGGEVGPDLTGLAKRAKRDYILESLVDPNKQIAKGFESVVLTTTSGQLKTGVLRGEDAKEVRILTSEGQLVVVPKDEIDDRQRGPSAMPGDLVQKLSRSELRDLVEFLSSLQ